MNYFVRIITCLTVILAAALVPAHALTPGQASAVFSLSDPAGKKYDLAAMKKQPMTILYFFDAQSRPSQEGLLSLDQLAKKYKGADLTVWGITRSSKAQVADFVSKTRPTFPILLDNGTVSDLYQAKAVLPAVYIIGPDLKLLDSFQGGGKTMNVMLLRLAERKLQQKQTALAQAISEDVARKNPGDVQATALNGYALLKAGKLGEAEKTFTLLSKGPGLSEILGKEGLAAVYARQGKNDNALRLAQEVEKKAPGRAYPHLVKADILYAQNKKQEARSEYETAVKKPEAESYQKTAACNKLGRLYASAKDYRSSRELYDKAVALDPYNVEAMSNKGQSFEKEGKWDQALASYQQGQAANRDDAYSRVLAARALDMLAFQKDAARQERVGKLVKELSERFRAQQKAPKPEDTWTSQAMVMSFVDFQEAGAMSEREGTSIVLTSQLSDQLKASGRVKVADRVLLDKLLEELNLGSSELANPETSLRLGRVLAARVMGTGTVLNLPEGTMLSMRLIDTETTAVAKVINMPLSSGSNESQDIFKLNRQILSAIIKEYPLHAYVVEISGGQALINLGSDQGVVTGTKFAVIEPGRKIEYKGKQLESAPAEIGRIEVVKTEPGLSYASIGKTTRPVAKDDKLLEIFEGYKE